MKIQFDIYGMNCQVCANSINQAVKKVEGVKKCNVNFVDNSMLVEFDEKKTNTDLIIKAVSIAGYSAKVKTKGKTKAKKELNFMVVRVVISIILLLPLLYITMLFDKLPQFYLINYHANAKYIINYLLVAWIFVLPIIIINFSFFTKGFKNLFKLHPTMDSLIAVGSATAFLYTSISFLISGILSLLDSYLYIRYLGGNYFDSCAMILTIVTFGKMLESKAKHKTTVSIDKLVQLIPEYATILVDGEEVTKKVEEIKVGDLIVVKMGTRVPIDGIVIEGSATLDTSTITGESIGTYVTQGSKVISSSLNQSGRIVVEATTIGTDSSMQKIIDLVNEAANSKAPISRIADEVSNFFVPIVMIISLLTFIFWILVRHDVSNGVKCAVSVLVVSCPCALGLATPVAIMASVGKASTFGVISKSAEAIEVASSIQTVILDKTGTITEGTPNVVRIHNYNVEAQEIIQVAYSLENEMVHPLSKAIIEYAQKENLKPYKVNNYEFIPGVGIKGVVNGRSYFLGNYSYVEEYTRIELTIKEQIEAYAKKGNIPLILAKENEIVGLICIADRVKKSSMQAIKIMKDLGINVVMATGDNENTAKAIASIVGVNEVRAEVLPQDKEKIVKEYQHKNKKKLTKVAMIGDGINDSLALVRSDLGIAIGTGSDITIDYGDIVLMKSDLLDAANMFRLEKKTMKIIRLNLFWALIYNVVLIPMATGVFSSEVVTVNPMISALCMSISSLFVVCTALTINKFKPIEYSELDNYQLAEKNKEEYTMTKIVEVDGMACEHCSAKVKKAIEALPNVVNVDINLRTKEVTIEYTNSLDLKLVKAAVEKLDYVYLG